MGIKVHHQLYSYSANHFMAKTGEWWSLSFLQCKMIEKIKRAEELG